MKIVVDRVQLDPDVTIGSLTVDGEWQCWTLEDVVRPVKIKGDTAIPESVYSVVITPSVRFKRDLPLLLNVPNFEGIRIHSGNTTADTEGCILVGLDRMGKSIGRSRLAFDGLFAKIRQAVAKGERVTIEIT